MKSLRQGVRDYLAMRHAMGFKLKDTKSLLPQFAAFVRHHGNSRITSEIMIRWAKLLRNVHPGRWTRRFRAARQFALYWKTMDSRTEVPPPDTLSHRYHRIAPYLLTNDDVARLMQAAKRLASPTRLAPWTYWTLIGLLSSTGLRIGEALALDREDVDLSEAVLRIRKTKFGKSRLVPLHPTTRKALLRYARLRDRKYPEPLVPAFFLSCRGRRLSAGAVHRVFATLRQQVGLHPRPGRRGPGTHALRHRFTVTTMLRWYRRGANVHSLIPTLSTYLGHTLVSCTYWYMSAAPELLRLAGVRLQKTLGGLP